MKLFKHIRYFAPAGLLLIFIQCKRTNWYENYREKEKSPFGTYIIFNETEALFDGHEVVYLEENIFDYLSEEYQYEEGDFANYICIKQHANKIYGIGITDLLKFVYDGNDVFLALNYFSEDLKGALGFETENLDEEVFAPVNLRELKGTIALENEDFSPNEFSVDRNFRRNYFTEYNKDKSIVLGTQKVGNDFKPNFIKVYHGKGAIYLHTQPIVFTNYFMLKENYEYAENVFSYLPDRKILWDPQLKWSDYQQNKETEDNRSVFKFFLQNPSLKWSLYVFFFGVLLFMLFNARRKQRPIPIIPELKNSTVEFAHTIANLYLSENDHKNLVDKKIQYFLEKIRREYLIDTGKLNGDFVKKLAAKSGNSIDATKYLINTMIDLNRKHECTQNELYRLNNLIDNFFKLHTDGGK